MRLLLRLILICFFALPYGQAQEVVRTIAVTVDDGPLTRFFQHPSAWHRQQVVGGLIEALTAHAAPATLFVIGEKVDGNEEAIALLQDWLDAGVEPGNHTYSHVSFERRQTLQFLDDIDRLQELLVPLARAAGHRVRYFRAPYLQDGRTAARQTALARHLERRGLRNAPVTIALEDWRFNDAYEAAERADEWEERYEIGHAYFRHAVETVGYFERLAEQLEGRPVAHVLLVHANTINRDYLGPILEHLTERGYRFVTLDEAYTDPIYSRPVPPTDAGSSLISRLAWAAGILASP